MNKYKVEGYIKVPVDVVIYAENEHDACSSAYDAVTDELPSGFAVVPCEEIQYQFEDDDTMTIIGVSGEYEYDFECAEVIK